MLDHALHNFFNGRMDGLTIVCIAIVIAGSALAFYCFRKLAEELEDQTIDPETFIAADVVLRNADGSVLLVDAKTGADWDWPTDYHVEAFQRRFYEEVMRGA